MGLSHAAVARKEEGRLPQLPNRSYRTAELSRKAAGPRDGDETEMPAVTAVKLRLEQRSLFGPTPCLSKARSE